MASMVKDMAPEEVVVAVDPELEADAQLCRRMLLRVLLLLDMLIGILLLLSVLLV